MVVGQLGICVHWYQPIRIHVTVSNVFQARGTDTYDRGDRLLLSSVKKILALIQFFLSPNYPGLIPFVFQLLEAFLEEALV